MPRNKWWLNIALFLVLIFISSPKLTQAQNDKSKNNPPLLFELFSFFDNTTLPDSTSTQTPTPPKTNNLKSITGQEICPSENDVIIFFRSATYSCENNASGTVPPAGTAPEGNTGCWKESSLKTMAQNACNLAANIGITPTTGTPASLTSFTLKTECPSPDLASNRKYCGATYTCSNNLSGEVGGNCTFTSSSLAECKSEADWRRLAQERCGSGTTTPPPSATNTPPAPSSTSSPTAMPTGINENQTIKQVIDSVSQNNIEKYLSNLVSISENPPADQNQTRYYSKNGNKQETTYIFNTLTEMGFRPRYQQFTKNNYTLSNVIATIDGTKPNEIYVIGAHMDSYTNQQSVAPGADDNGSGTVAVMEIARAIKASGITPNYTLEFVLFNLEELGMIGSAHYVDNFPLNKTIKGMINLDMIANLSPNGECVNFYYKPPNQGSNIAQLIFNINSQYNIGLPGQAKSCSTINLPGRSDECDASDHVPFQNRYPAIWGFECYFDNNIYHTTGDKTTQSSFSYSQLTKVTKAVAGAVINLALQQ